MVDPDWETFWEISLGCILGIYCPGEWEKLFGSPNKYHKMANGAHSNSKTQKVRDFLVVPRMIFHTINLNDHKSLEYNGSKSGIFVVKESILQNKWILKLSEMENFLNSGNSGSFHKRSFSPETAIFAMWSGDYFFLEKKREFDRLDPVTRPNQKSD